MKSMVRHYGPVALLLAAILTVCSLLSLLTGGRESRGGIRVLATNHSLYVATEAILSGTDTVTVERLSGSGAGCLHDYQLSPSDRLALAEAELVLTVGEADLLLEHLNDNAQVVDIAAGLDTLCADHHHEEGHHHEGEINEHLWVSPVRYQKMVLAVLNALIELEDGNEAIYRENATNYLMNIDYLWSEMTALPLQGRPCVLFHDSLAYLAEDLGWEVKLTLTFDGDSGIAPADLAAVEALAKEHPDLLLVYDTQYPIRYGGVDGLVPAQQVLALDTAVVGQGSPRDWVTAMEYNLEQLKQLTGGDAP